MAVPRYAPEREVTHWLPLVRATGVLTPETVVVSPPVGGAATVAAGGPAYWAFLARLLNAAGVVGYPFVLRTGLACAKHHWRSACLVEAAGQIDDRVRATQAWCDAAGVPVRAWVTQQHVPPVAGFTVYDGLPVGRAFRVFTRDAWPLCVHPVWPRAAVDAGRPPDPHWPTAYAALTELRADTDKKVLLTLAARAATHLPGDWATDWMATEDGRWVVLSAAPARTAWHAPECPHHPAAPGAATEPPVPPAAFGIDPGSRSDLTLVWALDQSLDDPIADPIADTAR